MRLLSILESVGLLERLLFRLELLKHLQFFLQLQLLDQLFQDFVLLYLLRVVLIANHFSTVRVHLAEQVLLLRWNLIEVQLVDVLVLLARGNRLQITIQTVHTRDKAFETIGDAISFLCVHSESTQYLVLVGVVKLIEIFILVIIRE